jgi:hypothetical protein
MRHVFVVFLANILSFISASQVKAQPAGAVPEPDDSSIAAAETIALRGRAQNQPAPTRFFVLGDAALNLSADADVKGIGSGGIAIRRNALWLRLFVSNSTVTTISAESGDRAFGRALLVPESGGHGAVTMVRWLPLKLESTPMTRGGFVMNLAAQETTWKTMDSSSDGITWGADLGLTSMAEGTSTERKNTMLVYADLLLMLRGVNRDINGSLRESALGTRDRTFGGFGLRVATKVDHLLIGATGSYFPRGHNIPGLTGAQLMLIIAIDGGIELDFK